MPLHLFQAFGVELEYMIVRRDTLDVLPATDQLLHSVAPDAAAEPYPTEVQREDGLSWSNELALHVVELKTTEPAARFHGLGERFNRSVGSINGVLGSMGGRLMPSAMHPWMDPATQMKLWPHEHSPVYEAFNRIFDCRGHGWANLQAVHLNLPFADDAEFARLHAAVRLILPILPAIAAASPMMDGKLTGLMDNRLDVYQSNASKVPSVSGRVIPEPVYSRADYESTILGPIYNDLAPHDPEGTLREEWVNARGAIARFDRNAIEIRVLDVQECPAADVAICAAVAGVLQAIVGERWSELYTQQAWGIEPLRAIMLDCIRDADTAVIRDTAYLRALGLSAEQVTAGELWSHLVANTRPVADEDDDARAPIEFILHHGALARRITRAIVGHDLPRGRGTGITPDRERIAAVYRSLCDCLAEGRMFLGV
jgi:gamma-glutamyl:cysteine ligase YbdK (ATP-grasp superfamily)